MSVSRLVDHGHAQERWAVGCRQRREMPRAFGEFLADLASWDWWFNPISFRDDGPSGPPVQAVALTRVIEYLDLLQRGASKPIGWVIGEEFGGLGWRYHCHILVTGVGDLYRKFWWAEAFRRFGRTKLVPFDRDRGAAFYQAEYEAKRIGGLHFGGTLGGVALSDLEIPSSIGGKQTVIRSAEMPKDFFRLGLGRWHR